MRVAVACLRITVILSCPALDGSLAGNVSRRPVPKHSGFRPAVDASSAGKPATRRQARPAHINIGSAAVIRFGRAKSVHLLQTNIANGTPHSSML